MPSRTEDDHAAVRSADAQMTWEQESRLWIEAPLLDRGQYRWALARAFRAGARHGRAFAMRDFMRTLSAEIDERSRWQRLAIGLSREIEDTEIETKKVTARAVTE